ncbi:sulfatase-like hydrolase/transferase [Lentisphaera profundi]|uniref:Sulfatase-like hydrolase/transferase n=1 Tax=Lentisphaera profundi TaxID=1658616 RepID=A0ABY7VXQ3_9BACT|nr:sulfatase-like hydrolase/transferase [Lentisphaera profundi]WDE98584.1 sulfatase-like hydrolase/transferase [Lentisphaera profundi]
MIKYLLIPCLLMFGTLQAKENKHPNFLFIFADDMSLDTIGAMQRDVCKTPNLDKLMASGASFNRSYNMGAWNGAVCMASRSMLNSGLFVNRAQEGINKYPHWSEIMRDNGYTTYMTGKWHVPGKPRFDVVRDARPGMPNTFPHNQPEAYNRPKSPEHYAKGWKPWDKTKGGFWEGGTHWSEVVANHGVDFIEMAKNDDKPFFMYIAFNATHDPRQAPKEYIDMYPLDSIKIPENFLSSYPYAEPMGVPHSLRDEYLMPMPRTEYAVKVHRQEYFALATHMDEQIGRILKALDDSGMADNTYIIFTADHGLAVGRHGLVGKQCMYDHSMQVPFFIAGPQIKAKQQFDMPIYLQDAMATTLDLAGINKPKHVQFNSVMPLINKKRKQQYPLIYGKYTHTQRMIQDGDYKLIVYPNAQVYRLFNTAKDPFEMIDLAKNPEYANKVKKLTKKLKKLMLDMDDTLNLDQAKNLSQEAQKKITNPDGH